MLVFSKGTKMKNYNSNKSIRLFIMLTDRFIKSKGLVESQLHQERWTGTHLKRIKVLSTEKITTLEIQMSISKVIKSRVT